MVLGLGTRSEPHYGHLEYDGVSVSLHYCFDVLPKDKRLHATFEERYSGSGLGSLLREKLRGHPYCDGMADDADKELFDQHYLADIPFQRWELKPVNVIISLKSGKVISCSARIHVIAWRSGFLSVTTSLAFMKESTHKQLGQMEKQDVLCLTDALSLDDLLSLGEYGSQDDDDPFSRIAQNIHHEVLTRLYSWEGEYKDLLEKIRYRRQQPAWSLTTLFAAPKRDPEDYWRNHVHNLLAMAYNETDWKETSETEWAKFKKDAEMSRVDLTSVNFSKKSYAIVGSAGIVQCIFSKEGMEKFRSLGIFHPLQRMVDLWAHQEALCGAFEAEAKSKTDELGRIWPPKRKNIDDLIVLRLRAESALDRYLRIDDYTLRQEVDELGEWVHRKWLIKQALDNLEGRLEDLAELQLGLTSAIQAQFFNKIAAFIAVFGIAGITSSFAYWFVSSNPSLELIAAVLALTFLPVIPILIAITLLFELRRPFRR